MLQSKQSEVSETNSGEMWTIYVILIKIKSEMTILVVSRLSKEAHDILL